MIRACLFDMGRVLVEFSHDQMLEQIAVECKTTAKAVREFLYDSGLLLHYEKGMMEEAELQTLLEEHFHCQLDRQRLVLAASDIFQEKPEMIPLLEELKEQGMKLVLLSNTSRIHFEFIRERFSVLNYFDDYVLSYQVKALKPDQAIYQAAIEAAGVEAEACFFTDDIEENILAARVAGIHAEQFFHRSQLISLMKEKQIPLTLE